MCEKCRLRERFRNRAPPLPRLVLSSNGERISPKVFVFNLEKHKLPITWTTASGVSHFWGKISDLHLRNIKNAIETGKWGFSEKKNRLDYLACIAELLARGLISG